MSDSNQENTILKKRVNTFKNAKGALYGLPDDLVIDLVRAWERWPGSPKSFYQGIGIKKQQMGFIIKKGKRLFKEGGENLGPFIPVEVKPIENCENAPMVLNWDKKNSISFYQVDHLLEFLKKAA